MFLNYFIKSIFGICFSSDKLNVLTLVGVIIMISCVAFTYYKQLESFRIV